MPAKAKAAAVAIETRDERPSCRADTYCARITEGVGRARNLPFIVVELLNRASDVVDGVSAAATLVRESGVSREGGAETMTRISEDALLKLIIVATNMLTDRFEEAAEWLFDEPVPGDQS